MTNAFITRSSQAASFTTTPTDTIRFLCAGDADTPDVEDERLSPGDGPPLHRHPWATWTVAVEGSFLVQIGDERHPLEAGDLAYTGPDVVHSFMCVGDGPGRLIHVNWPGGFHHMYAELAPLFHVQGPPDFAAMAQVAVKYGSEIIGPPMAMAADTPGGAR